MRRSILVLLTAFAAGCNGERPTGVERDLDRVERATARFQNIDEAINAGYTVWSPDPAKGSCPSSPEGNMGYHLVNLSLRGSAADPANADADIELEHPEMLLYEKQPDGTLRLVGVEYLVFKAAWEREHGSNAAPPALFGESFPMSTHPFTPGGPAIDHYELHVWLCEPNPLGMFYPWNPNVSC